MNIPFARVYKSIKVNLPSARFVFYVDLKPLHQHNLWYIDLKLCISDSHTCIFRAYIYIILFVSVHVDRCDKFVSHF